jgi:hypothetical protein
MLSVAKRSYVLSPSAHLESGGKKRRWAAAKLKDKAALAPAASPADGRHASAASAHVLLSASFRRYRRHLFVPGTVVLFTGGRTRSPVRQFLRRDEPIGISSGTISVSAQTVAARKSMDTGDRRSRIVILGIPLVAIVARSSHRSSAKGAESYSSPKRDQGFLAAHGNLLFCLADALCRIAIRRWSPILTHGFPEAYNFVRHQSCKRTGDSVVAN